MTRAAILASLLVVGCPEPAAPERPDAQPPPVDAAPPRPDFAPPGCVRSREVCNERDDDCDGRVDDDDPDLRRALFVDPENCGRCFHRCEAPAATLECRAGQCFIVACEPGFNDYNGSIEDGCESDCLVTAGGLDRKSVV